MKYKSYKIYKILIILILIFLFPVNCFATNSFTYNNPFTDAKPLENNDGRSPNYETTAKDKGKEAFGRINIRNEKELDDALDNLFGQIRWIISIVSVFGTITSFLIFSYAFVRLSTYPTDPILRRKCMVDILQSGIATVLLGGLSLILTIFYKTFMGFIENNVMLISNYKAAFAMALNEYKYLISGILGVLAITMLILFIKDILDLASSGQNPQARAKNLKGLLITGLATIGFGGTGIFVAIFNGLLVF